MFRPKPGGANKDEPTWVQKARARGSRVEERSGTFMIVETNDQPPPTRDEAANHDNDPQDSNEHAAVPAPAGSE